MTEISSDGQIGIIDGRIKVVDPVGEGHPAILFPAEEGANIYVNGELLTEARSVKQADIIETNLLTFVKEAKIDLKVSSDRLHALMAVYPQVTVKYVLEDCKMNSSLKPCPAKTELKENIFAIQDAEDTLKKNNITYGLDFSALKEVVEKADGEFKIIAVGKEVQEGKDGTIEFLVNPEIEAISYDQDKEKVDFRERYRFPAVRKGDSIAILHHPHEGVPGRTVSGDIIPAGPVKKAVVRCGEGVDFLEDKTTLVALKDGRLIVNGNHIKVVNVLTHNGDVNLQSGNIHFNGDIHIYGNIFEGMLVEARGDLYVQGNAYGATIKAGGNIHFTGKIIKCRIKGGIYFALLQKIVPLFKSLGDRYSSFLHNVKDVAKGLSERGQVINDTMLAEINQLILQKTSSIFMENIDKLEKLLHENEYPELNSLQEFLIFFKSFLTQPLRKKNILDELNKIESIFKALLENFEAALQQNPLMSVAYIQSSTVTHAGEINIIGKGSYYTTFNVGGNLDVRGIFCGGSIEAQGDVRIKEFVYIAGAEQTAKKLMHRIKVPLQSSIYFDLVHEDTSVQIGKYAYRFDQRYERVKVSYDAISGMLKLKNY